MDLLENAAEASGASVVKTIYKKFHTTRSVTVLSLLEESHISIHTWPERGEAAVDVFTCGDALPKIGCDIITLDQLECDRSHHLNTSSVER